MSANLYVRYTDAMDMSRHGYEKATPTGCSARGRAARTRRRANCRDGAVRTLVVGSSVGGR